MDEMDTACRRTAATARGLSDADLERPTPMDVPVGHVVQHLLGLAVAFRDAALKLDGPTTRTPPAPSTEPLPDDWRALVGARLEELAKAWREPTAWEGMTRAGGVELPGQVGGLVALDEVLLHGWDLAVATGAAYHPTDAECDAVLPIVSPSEQVPDGSDRAGLFGPVVAVPDGAPYFERVLGLAGRDPGWRPS